MEDKKILNTILVNINNLEQRRNIIDESIDDFKEYLKIIGSSSRQGQKIQREISQMKGEKSRLIYQINELNSWATELKNTLGVDIDLESSSQNKTQQSSKENVSSNDESTLSEDQNSDTVSSQEQVDSTEVISDSTSNLEEDLQAELDNNETITEANFEEDLEVEEDIPETTMETESLNEDDSYEEDDGIVFSYNDVEKKVNYSSEDESPETISDLIKLKEKYNTKVAQKSKIRQEEKQSVKSDISTQEDKDTEKAYQQKSKTQQAFHSYITEDAIAHCDEFVIAHLAVSRNNKILDTVHCERNNISNIALNLLDKYQYDSTLVASIDGYKNGQLVAKNIAIVDYNDIRDPYHIAVSDLIDPYDNLYDEYKVDFIAASDKDDNILEIININRQEQIESVKNYFYKKYGKNIRVEASIDAYKNGVIQKKGISWIDIRAINNINGIKENIKVAQQESSIENVEDLMSEIENSYSTNNYKSVQADTSYKSKQPKAQKQEATKENTSKQNIPPKQPKKESANKQNVSSKQSEKENSQNIKQNNASKVPKKENLEITYTRTGYVATYDETKNGTTEKRNISWKVNKKGLYDAKLKRKTAKLYHINTTGEQYKKMDVNLLSGIYSLSKIFNKNFMLSYKTGSLKESGVKIKYPIKEILATTGLNIFDKITLLRSAMYQQKVGNATIEYPKSAVVGAIATAILLAVGGMGISLNNKKEKVNQPENIVAEASEFDVTLEEKNKSVIEEMVDKQLNQMQEKQQTSEFTEESTELEQVVEEDSSQKQEEIASTTDFTEQESTMVAEEPIIEDISYDFGLNGNINLVQTDGKGQILSSQTLTGDAWGDGDQVDARDLECDTFRISLVAAFTGPTTLDIIEVNENDDINEIVCNLYKKYGTTTEIAFDFNGYENEKEKPVYEFAGWKKIEEITTITNEQKETLAQVGGFASSKESGKVYVKK